ncbi:GNAT family N-acetyltransferase [Brevibacterium atlanticum]|uniref:GNAT family N-acetyltransferase n=1 Tax=Brevibacterium atlanticum TaxID=2697563 RepID=UPI00141ED002|nr:GNAT family N-acetyltransferase [Brevibacterium atlanticum]
MTIRTMAADDWPAVAEIYAEGIAGGNATFATAPPSREEFFAAHIPELCLVATRPDDTAPDGVVTGWATAAPTSDRKVYRGVLEHSVYVATTATGRGVGTTLLSALSKRALDNGFWTLQASIFPENTASLRMHERAGFRVVGHRERIGLMSHGPFTGRWRDTVLVEKRL